MTTPIVGYYGKLPISPEFFRLNASGPEVRWLDDWLQQGMLYAKAKEGARWHELVDESDLWKFLYFPVDESRIVCGVLFASRDKAGRSFPFLYFLLLDRKSLSRKVWLAPLMAAEFLDAAECSLEGLRKNFAWDGFCQDVASFNGRCLEVESVSEVFGQYLRSEKADTWLAQGLGNSINSQKLQLVRRLTDLIHSLKQDSGCRFPWGFNFPLLKQKGESDYDLAFWLAAIVRPIKARQLQAPGLFTLWNRSPKKVKPCALVSVGPGSPHIIRFLVSPDAQDEAWRDMIQVEDMAEDFGETDEARLLSDPDLSLMGVLEYFERLP